MNTWARPWRDEIAIAALLALLAAALALGGWAWRADRLVYDLGLALAPRAAPADVVIVAIDEASIEAIGRWPWKRAVHATLLERLAALPAAARPRSLALDLVLSEPDPDPQQDWLLARAIAHLMPATPVLLLHEGAPPDVALRGGARLGAAEPAVDADGVLRHAYLWNLRGGQRIPHLALAMMQAAGEPLHPALRPLAGPAASFDRREGELALRFVGPPGSVRRVSYVDLLTGAVPAATLAGQHVLVGMTAAGLGDTLATPVNARHSAMPGVEVLANALYTFRSGDAPRPLPAPVLAAAAVLAVLALMAVLISGFGRFGARAGLALSLGTAALAVAASLVALHAGWWASPVPYAVPAALAYPLWSWRRLERAAVAQQTRRLLVSTLAAAPAAMLVAGADGRVRLANAQAAALFDVGSAEELQGLDLPRLLGEFDTATPTDWPAALAALAPGGPALAVEAQRRDDDSPAHGHDCVLHAAAVALDDGPGWVVAAADLAPVREAERRAERERQEALAFVSHDLRSPAASIVMLAELHGTPRAPAGLDTVAEMARLARRTLALADDFVRATHVRHEPLRPEPAPLQALLAEALADLHPQAAAAGVALQAATPGLAADAAFALDRRLVLRALGNLLGNAIRHAPAGSAVELAATLAADGALALAVSDRGPGLDETQLEQLARGDGGLAPRGARGVGLGLVFVQRVAARHGGTLQAHRREGGGTVFTLRLPASRSGNP